MKKFIFVSLVFLLGIASLDAAWLEEYRSNRSSYTVASPSTPRVIKDSIFVGDVLVGVMVSTSMPNGTLTIYDSSGTVNSTITVMGLSSGNSAFYIPFDVRLSSGLSYTATNNAGVTFIYKRLRMP